MLLTDRRQLCHVAPRGGAEGPATNLANADGNVALEATRGGLLFCQRQPVKAEIVRPA